MATLFKKLEMLWNLKRKVVELCSQLLVLTMHSLLQSQLTTHAEHVQSIPYVLSQQS